MSLDKSIKSKKEHRKQYRGSKLRDATCRNHGSCPWCEDNRRFHDRKNRIRAAAEVEDCEDDWEDVTEDSLDLDVNEIFQNE